MQAAESPKRKPLELTESFRPLPVNFLELWENRGWRVKVYGISRHHQRPGAELMAAGKRVAAEKLALLDDQQTVYGVGFLVLHEAREANFVSINWWAKESELHRRVFRSPRTDPGALLEVTGEGVAGTVWDLQVLWFERNAWVEKVLGNARGSEVELYLKKCLSDQA